MQNGIFSGASPFSQLIMLLFTMASCFLLMMVAGLLLAPLILGIPITDLINGMTEQHLNLMRYLQILQGFGLFIIPALLAAYLFSGNAVNYLGLRRNVAAKWYCAAALMILAAMPLINLLAALNEMIVFPQSMAGLEQRLRDFEEAAQQTTKLFLEVDNAGGMLFNIFMIAVLPAIGEELICRGMLQKIFTRWTGNVHVSVVVSGFLFSLMHLQFYGLFPRWLLGVALGYMLVWSGTIWLPVFAHFVQNAVAVSLSYLIHQGTVSEEVEEFGTAWSDIPLTLATTVIGAVCLWLLWKNSKKRVLSS
jgi:membrane protease YdiL (CAAX protease family)